VDCGVYALCAAEAHLTALGLAIQQLPKETGEDSASTDSKVPGPMTNGSFAKAQSSARALLASPSLGERLTPEAVAAKRSELLARALAL